MAFETTITEHDLDPKSQRFAQAMCLDLGDADTDLSVDGMSESILSRILGLSGSRNGCSDNRKC
jgi:hypothetical protein